MDETGPLARTSDPETSHAAAAQTAYVRRVTEFLTLHDRPEGWTWHELVDAGLDLGECPWHRITDARKKGWVTWAYRNGERVRRPGRAGAMQGANVVTVKGANHIRGY